MQKIILLVATCILLCSCNGGNLIDKIVVSHVENEGEGCYIDMAKELDFQWDSLFYFSIGCSLEEIQEAVGSPIYIDNDLSYLMIFLFEGRMVRSYRWDYSQSDSGVIIDVPRLIYKTSIQNAKFKVKKGEHGFILEPVNDTLYESVEQGMK